MGWFWQHIVTASALKGKVWGKKVVIFIFVLFLCNAVMPFIWKKNVKILNKCQICCIAAESDFSEPWIRVNGPKRATTASIFLLQNEIPQQVQHIWKKSNKVNLSRKGIYGIAILRGAHFTEPQVWWYGQIESNVFFLCLLTWTKTTQTFQHCNFSFCVVTNLTRTSSDNAKIVSLHTDWIL